VIEEKQSSDFCFDQDSHTYYVGGKTVPSVTQLTDIFNTFPVKEDSDLELTIEAAADRGTTLHGYLEHRLSGGDKLDYEMPDAYQGYADGVDLFLEEHRLEPDLIETPLRGETPPFPAAVHKIKFAGTPDYVGLFDSVFSILDWKFVSQVQKTKVGAQLNGYLDLCAYNGIFPEKLFCVQFLPDGTYRLYPVEISEECFRMCTEVYRLKTKKQPRGGIV